MKIALLGLPLVGQVLDPFGSIPAMPTALPSLAAQAKASGAEVQVIDAFAEAVERRFRPAPGLVARGLPPEELARRVDEEVELIGVSVHSVATDTVARQTLAALKRARPRASIVVGGAHPTLMPQRFFDAGADWVVCGEGERSFERLLAGERPAKGLLVSPVVEELDELPWPDFGVLPLERYWDLRLGHGPVRDRCLTISTSRGCSQGCRFCSTPALVRGRWRGMSAERVVELFERLGVEQGVREFHVEDDDFSAERARVHQICDLVLRRGLDIRLSLPSGVRAASLDVDVVRHLAQAGCRYLSLAPESGSARILRAMGKNVELGHLIEMAKEAVRCGMRVGCFLIVGFPGERSEDRRATATLVDELVSAGVDDLSIFIWSPLPGATAFDLERGWERLEQLCWTPRWRSRYALYEGARFGLYLRLLSDMFRSRPGSVAVSMTRAITGPFETKGEMTINRMLRWRR